jgi:uncharacterized membrane protein
VTDSKSSQKGGSEQKKHAAPKQSAARAGRGKQAGGGHQSGKRAGKQPSGQPQLLGAFELFKPSWRAIVFNFSALIRLIALPILIVVAMYIISVIIAARGGTPTTSISIIELALILASAVAFAIVTPAIYVLQLRSVRGKTITYQAALKQSWPKFWRYYGTTISASLIILGGFILFIVPGFFMIRRYILAPFYVIDRNIGVREALRQSAADSRHYSGAVWGLVGVQILISLVSIIPFLGSVIGIVAQVVYYFAPGVRYTEIDGLAG